jgi:hypothetical protein
MTDRRRSVTSGSTTPLASAVEITSVVGRAFPLYEVIEGACACRRPACARVGKHPRVRWGIHASNRPATLRALFAAHPNAGVGIATGRGLLVLDFDPERGGLDSLDRLQLHTARVLTGRANGVRGVHLWLRVDPLVYVNSSANAFPAYPGLDVRCAGGYVVAPPTLHRSGVEYEWDVPLSELADAPKWLIDALSSAPTPRDSGGTERTRSGVRLSPRMRTYLNHGIPLEGGQRLNICALARALLEVPHSVDEATDLIWDALLNSTWSKDPWTQEQVREIVGDIDETARPILKHGIRVKGARKRA